MAVLEGRRRSTIGSAAISTSPRSSTCLVADERAVEHVTLVAGVDSSTQSCKVVIWDAETGTALRHGRAPHPEGTEVHPDVWWTALRTALDEAGGLTDVAAVAVGAQQHGMVCLDEAGRVVRPALLCG